jgi:ABC-type branched-subunit amino acid transport system substrate-binding protein
MTKVGFAIAALTSLLLSGTALADDKIKVGVTATLEGTYTLLGEDGIRGFKVALKHYGGKIGDNASDLSIKAGGKELEFVIASTDATPDSAVRAVRKLIEQDKVQILISPLSGDEGIAVKNFSRTHPELTFINASSGAQETTFPDPSPNFFRYNMDGAQWQVGLGKYAYEKKGYKKIATLAEDYSFTQTQVFGLVMEFCKAGGEVTSRTWVPLGTKDFGSVIAALPDDVDAIYVGLGGGDALNFLNQYTQAGGKAHLMGGSILVDQTILSAKGTAKNALIGTLAASGQADTWDDPKWQAFVKEYQQTFPPEKRFASPSLLATNYYDSTMALILALNTVNGDLSDSQKKLKEALASIVLDDAPNGKIVLDGNRQAIGTNFVTEVVDDGKGGLFSKVVGVVPNVNQTLGYDPAVFKKYVPPSRTNPPCKKSYD